MGKKYPMRAMKAAAAEEASEPKMSKAANAREEAAEMMPGRPMKSRLKGMK